MQVGLKERVFHLLAVILFRVRGEIDPVVWFVPTKPEMQGKMGQWVLSAEVTLTKNRRFKTATGLNR